jgi:hypothetical protein
VDVWGDEEAIQSILVLLILLFSPTCAVSRIRAWCCFALLCSALLCSALLCTQFFSSLLLDAATKHLERVTHFLHSTVKLRLNLIFLPSLFLLASLHHCITASLHLTWTLCESGSDAASSFSFFLLLLGIISDSNSHSFTFSPFPRSIFISFFSVVPR